MVGKEGRTDKSKGGVGCNHRTLTTEGLRIIDPIAQTQALLSKFLIRGLQEGTEGWRALIQHRVATLQPAGNKQWPPGSNWLMTAKKIR